MPRFHPSFGSTSSALPHLTDLKASVPKICAPDLGFIRFRLPLRSPESAVVTGKAKGVG